jgi:hypothetical protein
VLGGVSDWEGELQLEEEFWADACFQNVPGQFNHVALDPMAKGHTSTGPKEGDYDSTTMPFSVEVLIADGQKHFHFPNQPSQRPVLCVAP